jgi:hypothetical protein
MFCMSQDNSGKVSGYCLDEWGLFSTMSRSALAVPLLELKTDRSPPSSAEVKNVWNHTGVVILLLLVIRKVVDIHHILMTSIVDGSWVFLFFICGTT